MIPLLIIFAILITFMFVVLCLFSVFSAIRENYRVFNACETIVRRAVAIVAAGGHEPMFGRIAKFTVKDEIKAELVASSSVANIEKIAENISQPAIIIFASPEAFMGERQEAKPDKDQPALPGTDSDPDMPDADPSSAPKAA